MRTKRSGARESTSSCMEALSNFIEAGRVRPVVEQTYPLAEAPDAIRHLEAGQARGKIALTI